MSSEEGKIGLLVSGRAKRRSRLHRREKIGACGERKLFPSARERRAESRVHHKASHSFWGGARGLGRVLPAMALRGQKALRKPLPRHSLRIVESEGLCRKPLNNTRPEDN